MALTALGTKLLFNTVSMASPLAHAQAPLLQQLAFQELAAVAQTAPGRRAGLWADDSGGAWRAAVQPCLAQVCNISASILSQTTTK